MKNFFPRVKDLPPPSVSSFSNNPTPDLAPDIISSFGEGEQFALDTLPNNIARL